MRKDNFFVLYSVNQSTIHFVSNFFGEPSQEQSYEDESTDFASADLSYAK